MPFRMLKANNKNFILLCISVVFLLWGFKSVMEYTLYGGGYSLFESFSGLHSLHVEENAFYEIVSRVSTIALFIIFLIFSRKMFYKEIEQNRKLKKETKIFQAIQSSAFDGILIIDKDSNIIWQNTKVTEGRGNIIGRKCYEALENKDSKCDHCVHLDVFKDGESRNYETTIFHPETKKNINLLVRATPIFNDNGEIESILEVSRDITELKESEFKHKKILESTIEGVFIVGENGKILEANEAYCNLLGYTQEEILTKKVKDVEYIENEEEVEKHIKIMKEKESDIFETKHIRKDGKVLDIEISTVYIPENDCIFAFAKDITERKENFNRIKEVMKRLAKSNQELEEFAYVASHDLQEPLRKIMAFGEIIETETKDGVLNEKGKDYLKRILNAAERMKSLIEDLLQLSRISTKNDPFLKCDVNKIFSEALDFLDMKISLNQIDLQIDKIPEIECDQVLIRQLFINLLSNSIKFKSNKKLFIGLFVKEEENKVILSVQDNGIGFDPKYKNFIFQPFQRLYSRKEYPGSGIGLAICKKIVSRHRGRIEAISKEGQGTIIKIELPKFQRSDT